MVAASGRSAAVRVVVDLGVQRVRRDDPGRWAPALEGVGRLYTLLDLLTRTFLAVPPHVLH